MASIPERVEVDGRWCYRARWSKDEERLLCGHPTCGNLGAVWGRSGRHFQDALQMPSGFMRGRDGIWRLSKRQRDRVGRGFAPKQRRPWQSARLTRAFPSAFMMAEPPNRCLKDRDLIECQRCGRCNLFEFDALDLEPWTCNEPRLRPR